MKHHMLLIVKAMLCRSLLICWTPLLHAIQDETAAVCKSCGRQSEFWLKSIHPSSITLSLTGLWRGLEPFHHRCIRGGVHSGPVNQLIKSNQATLRTHTCTPEVHSESPVQFSSECMSLTVWGGQRTCVCRIQTLNLLAVSRLSTLLWYSCTR